MKLESARKDRGSWAPGVVHEAGPQVARHIHRQLSREDPGEGLVKYIQQHSRRCGIAGGVGKPARELRVDDAAHEVLRAGRHELCGSISASCPSYPSPATEKPLSTLIPDCPPPREPYRDDEEADESLHRRGVVDGL